MAQDGYAALRIARDAGVAWVTLDHPPINLFDTTLMRDLYYAAKELAADEAVRVVVLQSAHPDFFIAHADLHSILDAKKGDTTREGGSSFFQALVERWRTMPQATIAKLAGRARGGGSELVLGLDMRFGAYTKAVLSQPEVMLGILPGGGGTQNLTRLVGRGRALEIILGCGDVTAEVAERYGYINRGLPPEELDHFVDDLARRIATFPREAIAHAKQAVDGAGDDRHAGLVAENDLFYDLADGDEARRRMRRFLEAGGQTCEGELDDLTRLAETLRDG